MRRKYFSKSIIFEYLSAGILPLDFAGDTLLDIGHEGDYAVSVSKKELVETDVLLPMANPENSIYLIDLAGRLHRETGKRLLLMQLINSHKDEDEASELLVRCEKLLQEHFSVDKRILLEKNPARGIVKAARECKAKSLIVGWHGENVKNRQKGRVLDPVLRNSPCSVIIGKGLDQLSRKAPRQILVPLTGVRESDVLALKAAESMIDPSRGGRITILYFKRSPIRLNHINYLLTQVISSPFIRLDGIASDSEKPVKTTILQSREFDLITIGLIEPWLFRRGKPSFSERVAQEYKGAMLMVRPPQPVRSRIHFFT